MKRGWRVVAAVSVAAAIAVVGPWAFARVLSVQGTALKPQVSSSGQSTLAKVSPSLARAAARAGRGAASLRALPVAVLTTRRAPRPFALARGLQVQLLGDKTHRMWVGSVRPQMLVKLASSTGVLHVFDNGPRSAPPSPDPSLSSSPDRRRLKVMAAAARAMRGAGPAARPPRAVRPAGAGRDPRYDWADVGPVHKSSAAWAKGYTGTGVKVAVADDGLDFGHPDLAGTEARITDPSSPYAGWPMAYDPYSMALYAQDRYQGTHNVRDGLGWYVDTATTVTASATGTAVFDGATYKLPAGSASGVYHLGLFPDQNLTSLWYGEAPAVCVVDSTTPGVYDRVYVDLNDNYDFTDDTPQYKTHETATLDFWNSAAAALGPDGYADLSAGTLYYVADGTHHPPAFDWVWQQYDASNNPLPLPAPPKAGDMVAFMGAFDSGADHGTLCGSAVAAQGVVNGNAPSYEPTFTGAGSGLVQGAGRAVKLIAIADIYNDHFLSSLLAYDFAAVGPDGVDNSGDEAQIVSNSYGDPADDADAWDYRSRYITDLNSLVAPKTAYLFATGNGGPGSGTNTPPTPASGISVGASTLFGSVGTPSGASLFDSIESTSQMTFGDVMPLSSRGPTAMGDVAPHVVADGAFAAGDLPLSLVGDGWTATAAWGGTSRSAPVAAGNLALVMQAYKARTGSYPDSKTARDLLMNGATDLGYDPQTQGAGMVDADRSTDLAAGVNGASVSPSEWTAGDYRGTRFASFSKVIAPGKASAMTFQVTNPSHSAATLAISDEVLHRTGQVSLTIPTALASEDASFTSTQPDYLVDITRQVPTDCDLMVVRVTHPYSTFDVGADYTGHDQIVDSSFEPLLYDWTDRNHDGRLWTDANSNGAVNAGEIQPGEYLRFTYSDAVSNSHELKLRHPAGRFHDGLFLGLQHRYRDAAVPATPVSVTLEFYKATDFSWLSESKAGLTVAASSRASFVATLAVPRGTAPGTYASDLVLTQAGRRTIVPVTANVEAAGTGFSIQSQGADRMEVPGPMHGLGDWSWAPDAGDWRFAFADVADKILLPDGALWLARTSWETTPTDLDTLMFGPTPDEFTADRGDPLYGLFGPYGLAKVGGSPNTNFIDVANDAAGKWRFATSTGGAQDLVAAPIANGLHLFAVHDVLFTGTRDSESFRTDVGMMVTDPNPLEIASTATSGTQRVAVTPGLPLSGLTARAFGFVRPDARKAVPISDGTTWTADVTLTAAASLDVAIGNSPGNDLDLYLSRWDGSEWAPVASSAGATDEEHISVMSPVDGTYRVEVYGYDVAPSPSSFDVTVTAIQGAQAQARDLPAGALSAAASTGFNVSWTNDWGVSGTSTPLLGMVLAGPPESPRAVAIPVTLTYGNATKTTLAPSAAIVSGGRLATLKGRVSPSPGGGSVAFDVRPWTTSRWMELATATPAADGRFSFTHLPSVGTYYRARFLGRGLYAKSRSKPVTVQVRVRIALKVPKKMIRGRVYWFRASVTPGHPTRSLSIMRFYKKKWRLFRNVRPYRSDYADGAPIRTWYKTKMRLWGIGSARFRATFADTDDLHLPLTTGTVRVKVYRRPARAGRR